MQVFSNCFVEDCSDISIKKLMANPTDLEVEDKKEWRSPKIGDKVEVISYDTQVDVKECVRVAKLPYLTVNEINPIVVGVGNDRYCWAYEIGVEETHLTFLQYHYRILSL